MTKSNGNASDHRLRPAVALPLDEPVAGSDGQPESIPPCALLAQVLDRANLQRALKQVRRNKGAPGIDGMTVDELPEHLLHHWLEIRAQLEAGHYRPQPVKRVEIPKGVGAYVQPSTLTVQPASVCPATALARVGRLILRLVRLNGSSLWHTPSWS